MKSGLAISRHVLMSGRELDPRRPARQRPRAMVYRVLLDTRAIARWKVPTGMTSHVHAFEAREGGSFRISLTYDEPPGTGKTTAHTDTYHGCFVKLVTNEQVVERGRLAGGAREARGARRGRRDHG